MLGTYASFVLVLGCSTLVGQAIRVLCGSRTWSALSPAVGLAALLGLAWATVRLPGEGVAAAIAIGIATLGSLPVLLGARGEGGPAVRGARPVAVAATLAGSVPFIAEMRFGILGTGLNPDMSQHLFAVDRLASGGSERLIGEGYPLGPHSIVTALAELGPSTVHSFDGLMLAVAVATCLAALAAIGDLAPWKRIAGALVVGFAYLLAANFVQGAFKEAMVALFALAFAIGLGELARTWSEEGEGRRVLRALPLAVIAIGTVYAYSFPGLAWLVGAAGLWAMIEVVRGGVGGAIARVKPAAPAALAALGLLAIATLPELGRMIDFAKFETFDPDGAGLGNLFDRLSPLEAFGIWPSGDFRVEPGDGAAPAILFYLGAAFGIGAFAFGLRWWLRRGATAVPAAVGAAALLWVYTYAAGTPYQEAKALVVAAPLIALVSVRGLLAAGPAPIAVAFLLAAGGSGALALVNGPVGPSGYSPALADVRAAIGEGSVQVEAPAELLDEQHGRDYIVWELRGNHVCVAAPGGPPPEAGVVLLAVTLDDDGAVVPEGTYRTAAAAENPDACPLIEDGARADPAGDD